MDTKYNRLKEILAATPTLAVAFSGGVDSAFLLRTAADVLGDGVLALTVRSCFFPQSETRDAEAFCKQYGIRQQVLTVDALSIPGVAENPQNRCYFCKKEIFSLLQQTARAQGIATLAEGSNADDLLDFRPGRKAVEELQVISPLLDARLTKAEIRALSQQMGLPTWNKPSLACLASRIAYGETITKEKLAAIERAEAYLHRLGIVQLRVRVHGNVARIETEPDGFAVVTQHREAISKELRACGFTHAALDLIGYRTGSMNA